MKMIGQTFVLFITLVANMLFQPITVSAQVGSDWCTHATAERLTVDLNGDGTLDAICHDRSGGKWAAITRNGRLHEVWSDNSNVFCTHTGSKLFAGDVNGDGRGDLVCKDSGRIWVDIADDEFFYDHDFYTDTVWCTHRGSSLSMRDMNGDGRQDLVCSTSGSPHIFVDLAARDGQFLGNDFHGECVSRRFGPPYHLRAESTDRSHSTAAGKLDIDIVAVGLESEKRASTFIAVRGFSHSLVIPTKVSVRPVLEDGGLSWSGVPAWAIIPAWGDGGVVARLEVRSLGGQLLCSDQQTLNQANSPGFNADLHLRRPRELSCSAHFNGNYEVRVVLLGWATAVGGITYSTDATLQVNSLSAQECRNSV